MASLVAAHAHYVSLLHRLGRCLSFGCSGRWQMLQAASLASAITHAWPWAFLKKDDYITMRWRSRRWPGPDPQSFIIAAANASNGRLIQRLLGPYSVFWSHLDYLRLEPIGSLTFNRPTGLLCFSGFGDREQTLATLLQDPSPWAEGSTSRITLRCAVFSPSKRPLALVTQVLRLDCWELRGITRDDIPHKVLNWQGETVRRGEREVKELERRVRELELATWDREGAVEDTGGR